MLGRISAMVAQRTANAGRLLATGDSAAALAEGYTTAFRAGDGMPVAAAVIVALLVSTRQTQSAAPSTGVH